MNILCDFDIYLKCGNIRRKNITEDIESFI